MEDEMACPKELMTVVRDTIRAIVPGISLSTMEQARRLRCSVGERYVIFNRPEVQLSEERARDICVALGINWDDVIAVSKQRWQHNEEYTRAVNNIAKACTRE